MGKKFTEQQIEQINRNSKATLAFEGLEPSTEAEELGKKMLRGEISEKEALNILIKKHKRG